jgi:hypothetical protein
LAILHDDHFRGNRPVSCRHARDDNEEADAEEQPWDRVTHDLPPFVIDPTGKRS